MIRHFCSIGDPTQVVDRPTGDGVQPCYSGNVTAQIVAEMKTVTR